MQCIVPKLQVLPGWPQQFWHPQSICEREIMLQRERARELEATLERVRGEVSAQGMALEALAAERDAARTSAREAADRAKVTAFAL